MANLEELWNQFIAQRNPDGITFYAHVPNGKQLVPGGRHAIKIPVDTLDRQGAQDALNNAYLSIIETLGPLVPVELMHDIQYDGQDDTLIVVVYQIQ